MAMVWNLGSGRVFTGLFSTRIGNLILVALGVCCAVFGGKELPPLRVVGIIIAVIGGLLFIFNMYRSINRKRETKG